MSENRDAPLKRSSDSPRAAATKRVSRTKNTTTTGTKEDATKAPARKRAAGETATRRSADADSGKAARETTAPLTPRARAAETTTSRPRRKRASAASTQSQPGAAGTQNNASAGLPASDEVQSELQPVSPDERRDMIRRIAYFRAQWRGWMSGSELDDWLHAEREVDAMLRGERTD